MSEYCTTTSVGKIPVINKDNGQTKECLKNNKDEKTTMQFYIQYCNTTTFYSSC